MRSTCSVFRKLRHKRVLRQVKGCNEQYRSSFTGARTLLVKKSIHAFRSRKQRKRDMNALWNIRINAALRETFEISYSRFMHMTSQYNGTKLTKKMLAHLCFEDKHGFASYALNIVKNFENLNSMQ